MPSLSKTLVQVVWMISALSANAATDDDLRSLTQDIVADSWADEQALANMITNKINSVPSVTPSNYPTRSPSSFPSEMPSLSHNPTSIPSIVPSVSSEPTKDPTASPSISIQPTSYPSFSPSSIPSVSPSISPSSSAMPSYHPTSAPTVSSRPSILPSFIPSALPTFGPSKQPTSPPSTSLSPSMIPIAYPSYSPSFSSALTELNVTSNTLVINENKTRRSTSLLIIGACCVVVMSSAALYLYRRGAASRKDIYHDEAPMIEVSTDRNFTRTDVISPVSNHSGFIGIRQGTFDRAYSDHLELFRKKLEGKEKKHEIIGTDLEIGKMEAIPESVVISSSRKPSSSIDDQPMEGTRGITEDHGSLLMQKVKKYFQGSSLERNDIEEKRITWVQVREENLSACSSGCAPASASSPLFSPEHFRELPTVMKDYGNDTDIIDHSHVEEVGIKKSNITLGYNSAYKKTENLQERNGLKMRNIFFPFSIEDDCEEKSKSSEISMSGKSLERSTSPTFKMRENVYSRDLIKSTDRACRVNEETIGSISSGSSSIEWGIDMTKVDPEAPLFNEKVAEVKTHFDSMKTSTLEEQPPEIKADDFNPIQLSYSQTPVSCQKISFPPTPPSELSHFEGAFFHRQNEEGSPSSNKSSFIGDIEGTNQSNFNLFTDYLPSPNGAPGQLYAPNTYQQQSDPLGKDQDISFQSLLNHPGNELYECTAPPGPLGITIDSTQLGPRVKSLNPLSSLFDTMCPGDIIVGVDDVDTVGMEPAEFWQIVSQKANQKEIIFTLLKI